MKENSQRTGTSPFSLSQRKVVTVSSHDLVELDYLDSASKLPLVVRARKDDTDLIGWTKTNLSLILSELQRHGAILFRGFPIDGVARFREFVGAVSGQSVPYSERTSPRTRVIENVYTSTDYPSNQSILPHNENSYAITFPRKLYFWCETAPERGGETPLCDTRRVLSSIHRSVLDRFLTTGWMYVRNFNPHFGLPWQTAFQSVDRSEVEHYCRKAAIEREWTPVGLRTRQVRPAVARHPESGEPLWFNHAAFFHISNVEPDLRDRLLAQYEVNDLPNNTYYGDGLPIKDSAIQYLLEAYKHHTVAFPWEQKDLLLIDNMLVAHARAPFIGPRRILVSMAEPYTRTDIVGT
jgi:alpha-ketoglutarate-dependent taurine dioxygenase